MCFFVGGCVLLGSFLFGLFIDSYLDILSHVL